MIIIVEGPDGAGKTTFCQTLTSVYNLEYHHEGPTPANVDPLQYYGKILYDARDKNIVFDRFALGERVYGPLLRDGDRLGLEGWNVFHRLVTAVGAIEIMCITAWEDCLASWRRKHAQELIKDESIFQKTYQMWMLMMNAAHFRVYDYHEDDIPRLETQAQLKPNMIGDPLAVHLFVGDRGSNLNSDLDLPFFGTTDSAAYLNKALELASYEESEIAFINAYPLTSAKPRQIPTQFQRVIALGENASRALDEQKIEHRAVPHPQFWRRFRHHDIHGYAELLQECKL